MTGVQPSGSYWNHTEIGAGRIVPDDATLRLTTEDATAGRYSNAQLDDYGGLPRSGFPWQPPVTLTVRARFSHSTAEIRGTAGFGFWNDFFMADRLPTLPRAAWFFFASPPSDMRLDAQTAGSGWKAATIDALRPSAPLLLAAAPLAVPLMNLPGGFARLWPYFQRICRIHEQAIDSAIDTWHTYTLEWRARRARFLVDGQPVLDAPTAPAGPLGLVLWLDNQYLVAQPWGRLRHGLLDAPGRQYLEIASIEVT